MRHYSPLISLFPKFIQQFVLDVNKGLGLPVDYLLNSVLFACSVAIGNAAELCIKTGWTEGTVLYLVIVGPPGVAKTPSISLMLKPLEEKNKELFKSYKENMKEYADYSELKHEKAVSDNLQKPVLQQCLIDDATIEAKLRLLHDTPRGIGMYVDEILQFFNNINRYNSNGEIEMFLKMWNKKSVIVNRVSAEPMHIYKPNLSIIGGIQNELLTKLWGNNRGQNGFINRLLFVAPDNLRKALFSDYSVSQYMLDTYQGTIFKLFDINQDVTECGEPKPVLLYFTATARKLYENWYNSNSEKINSGTIDVNIVGFYSKMDMYVARFALIFQLLYWTCYEDGKESVGERAVQSAIHLSDYYLATIERVICMQSNTETVTKPVLKEFAKILQRKKYSLREIGSILDCSHQTISNWLSAG